MVRIPYIKIPSVRVGSIDPTSDIGTGGATPAPPTPIIYLTQWRMMGNSTVHTDEYLTQWKVEGNSVVDNNTILSCGDLGQDGKYHVKISNGVTIYDIPLTEPLRKVGDVADNIEFVNGVATVTRNIVATKINDNSWGLGSTTETTSHGFYADFPSKASGFVLLCAGYNTLNYNFSWGGPDLSIGSSNFSNPHRIYIKDLRYNTCDEFLQGQGDNVILYELETPTTEVIQVSPFPMSPTDTYTSANDTPYSAFEYKNVEIWSCGEYSAVDGKYHILVQPLGGSIADIALDEPLRKVNDVADKIEFADSVGTLTRYFASDNMGTYTWSIQGPTSSNNYRFRSADLKTIVKHPSSSSVLANILCAIYDTITAGQAYATQRDGISVDDIGIIYLFDAAFSQADALAAFKAHIQGVELIYELATPTTETIQVPQIQEADSYSCVISQGGKAVEWSSFETEINSN